MRRIFGFFGTDARDNASPPCDRKPFPSFNAFPNRSFHEGYGQPTDVIFGILVQPRDGPLRDALRAC